jgi:hypothetical protein
MDKPPNLEVEDMVEQVVEEELVETVSLDVE